MTEADPFDAAAHRGAVRAFLVLLSARVRHFTLGAEAITGEMPNRSAFEPSTWAMGLIDSTHPPGAHAAALATQAAVGQRMAAFLQGYDAVLTPTLAAPPLPVGATNLKFTERLAVAGLNQFPVRGVAQAMLAQIAGNTFAWAAFTALFNMTGQPAMSVPLSWNRAGVPIGVQLAGRVGEDAGLFQLAGQLERARPWWNRRPG